MSVTLLAHLYLATHHTWDDDRNFIDSVSRERKSRRLIGELIVYTGIRRPSGVRPSSVRRPSTFSNDISSEAVRPILSILRTKHLQVGGTKSNVFYSGRIRTLVAMATYSFHRLIMEKVEIDNFCRFIGDIWFFLQKCLLSSPPRFIRLLSKSIILIGWRCNIKGKFSKKIFKNLLLWNHKEDEAETWHTCLAHYPLQKLCFYSGRIRTLVAMATYRSHRLITGKVEIDNFCKVIGDIWFFYRNI